MQNAECRTNDNGFEARSPPQAGKPRSRRAGTRDDRAGGALYGSRGVVRFPAGRARPGKTGRGTQARGDQWHPACFRERKHGTRQDRPWHTGGSPQATRRGERKMTMKHRMTRREFLERSVTAGASAAAGPALAPAAARAALPARTSCSSSATSSRSTCWAATATGRS